MKIAGSGSASWIRGSRSGKRMRTSRARQKEKKQEKTGDNSDRETKIEREDTKNHILSKQDC